MKMINGVSMIPFGLLAGFADQNEIRIIELAENGFRFRTAKDSETLNGKIKFGGWCADGDHLQDARSQGCEDDAAVCESDPKEAV